MHRPIAARPVALAPAGLSRDGAPERGAGPARTGVHSGSSHSCPRSSRTPPGHHL